MRDQLLLAERVLAIAEELTGFIVKEIVDDAREFIVNRRY